MRPDRVLNPELQTFELDALSTALRGQANRQTSTFINEKRSRKTGIVNPKLVVIQLS